ncbi:CHASE2 domain-containing protein [Flavivirga rizhaonensis]|uniref:CHASE2 domain-containing protein n=1 Tax=Flavivirga rizhaonensis TaxID=2559571 RepID=A0A4V3P5C6_9FLAO|nr:CHASE2 domain-containing protein [Flavivirga rizhaonensis]TGV04834.1 CHASE2 domain-containing protein [Flavivirga rizhaonensis]
MKIRVDKVLYRDALLCTIITFIVAGILYFAFVNLSILDPFEKAFKDFKFTDIFYSERMNKEQRNNKIVIVNIKHADRFQIAQVIDKINAQDPSVIGLDIIFKDRKSEFMDSILKSAFVSNERIVTAYFHDKDSIVNNHQYFQFDGEFKGYINLDLKGQNSVIRDFQGVKGNNNDEFAFATQLSIKAGYMDESYARKELKKPIPINYTGNKDVFLSFDIEEVLNTDKIPSFKDAVVILGYLGDGNKDYDIEDKHYTPLNEEWVGRAVPDTFGVIIHANILNMLSKQNLIHRVSKFTIYLLSFIVCFFTILFSMKLHIKNGFVFSMLEKIIQLLLSIILVYLSLLLLQANIYLSVVPMILLSVLGIGMIGYYERLVKYLNKKFKWKSRLS